MNIWYFGVMIALAAGAPAMALAQDTLDVDSPRAEQLRGLIEERFAQRLTIELGLNDDQAARTRVILSTWGAKRRELERDERRYRQQLNGAMRPGVAANDQAVTRLVDAILNGRVAYVQTFKDEQVDLAGVLSPAQRAQYVLLRDRLMQRVQEIRNQRQGEGALLGGRLRPRPR